MTKNKKRPSLKKKTSKKPPMAREKPHCSFCQNHKKKERKIKLHKCIYVEKKCPCPLCVKTRVRQEVMRNQQRLWRHEKIQTPFAVKETSTKRKYKCSKCMNHNSFVDKANHPDCPYEKCSCYKCELVDRRQAIMKRDQMAKRMGLTMKSPIDDDQVDGSLSISAGIQPGNRNIGDESLSNSARIQPGNRNIGDVSTSTSAGIHRNRDSEKENSVRKEIETFPPNSESLSGLNLEEIASEEVYSEEIGLGYSINTKEISAASSHIKYLDCQPDRGSKISTGQLQPYALPPSESLVIGVQRNSHIEKINPQQWPIKSHKLLNTLGSVSPVNTQTHIFPRKKSKQMFNVTFRDFAPIDGKPCSMVGFRYQPRGNHYIPQQESLSPTNRPVWLLFKPSVHCIDPSKFQLTSADCPLDLTRAM